MSVWTTANNSGLETPTKSPITSSVPRAARSSAVITTGNHQQHHFQHVVAAAVAAATSVATGHQFQQQFPLHAHPHPHPQHHSNSPTGSGSNSNNSAGFQRTSISNSLLQFPPPPPPSSQNQAKVSPITNQFPNLLSLSTRTFPTPTTPILKRCYGSCSLATLSISLFPPSPLTISLTRWQWAHSAV